ncbi:zinc finger, C2H2 type family protein (macronuclear) [Tetrahymena thermophila SB210]|uniref:Zinc finger, C2H2 type family protein n=1 Tax=Tetrahymena thermophila (strain SB210) TaxID=312017 RepID=I7ME19_TETTS|nr:zinc finger, C2H2 type family protein [Tetrahymena thermophila SB210]EAR93868.2 zinc finger, C2H2 type family protein [Tetrahymena thermophila SB210]|eukprot:XP_001014113.2 zinc finger, C2H2 type family protein [Tetrahymena thermophila SB210]
MSYQNFQSQFENFEIQDFSSQNEEQYDTMYTKNDYQYSGDQKNYENQHSMGTNSQDSTYYIENQYNSQIQVTNEITSLHMNSNNSLSRDSNNSQKSQDFYFQGYQQQSQTCINQYPKNSSFFNYKENDVNQHENNNQNYLHQEQNNSNYNQFIQNYNNNFTQQKQIQNEYQQQLANPSQMQNQFQEGKYLSSNQNIVNKQQNSMEQENANQKDKKNYKPQYQCKECKIKRYKNYSGLTNHVKKFHPGRKTSELSMEPNTTLGRKPIFRNNQQN